MKLNDEALLYKKPEELLSRLIRFNTTNPPGNEAECIKYIDKILKAAGIDTKIVGVDDNRLSLIARLKGKGNVPPFLMYGHIDVVTTENQNWKHDPFAGVIVDECVWGRGALDMKGEVTMMICALIQMKTENIIPEGDIILTVLCDEENDGIYGGEYVVDNYSEIFKDVQYAIGEIGGFTMHLDNKKFYPLMVAEKQKCSLKATIKGPGGHGSMPLHDGAMAKLGHILSTLNKKSLPVHITPPAKMMIDALAKNMSFPSNVVLSNLLHENLTESMLKIMGNSGRLFDPILHNTVNATIVRGGNKVNVIPGKITLELDGRVLPGFTKDDLISELFDILGNDIEFEVTYDCPGPEKVNMGLFSKLSDIIKEGDKEAIPIPFIVSGVTDARFFSKLGIQTYGFTPMILPKDIDFSGLIHGENERIPVKALKFGVEAIFKLLKTV